MIGIKAINRRVTSGQCAGCTNPFRNILTDRAGIAPPELAFLLAFVALVASTGLVLVEDKLTEEFSGASERVEMARGNMPNPLGGGANMVVASNAGNSNGNGNGNGGKNK